MTERASASCNPSCASALRYGGPEDDAVVPVVVAELELGHVEWQVLGAGLVEGAHDPALDEGPEPVDRLRVDGADHMLLASVADELVREILAQTLVVRVFVHPSRAGQPWWTPSHGRSSGALRHPCFR